MPIKVAIKQQHRGSTLNILFFVVGQAVKSFGSLDFITEPLNVDNLATVRFKFSCEYPTQKLLTWVSVKKFENANETKVKVEVNCDKEEINLNCTDNWSEFTALPNTSPEFDLDDKINYTYISEVKVTVQDATDRLQPYENLYADKMCTDLELCATDGPPVEIHRVVIVQHSELFRELLSNPDMKNERQFPIKGVTSEDLQQLREYVYKGTLPLAAKGLPQLLLLAIHGRMKQLKNDCISKLAAVVTGDYLDELIAFAIKFNIPELIHAILSSASDKTVDEAHKKRKHKLPFCTRNFSQMSLKP